MYRCIGIAPWFGYYVAILSLITCFSINSSSIYPTANSIISLGVALHYRIFASWAKQINKDTVRIILLFILTLKDPFEPNSTILFKYLLMIFLEKQLINIETANEITLNTIKYKSHNDNFLLSIILIPELNKLLTPDTINQIFLTTTDPRIKAAFIIILNK